MSGNKNMKKLILMGRSGAGKTTLIQALTGEEINYRKTQGVEFEGFMIDTPGEYAENATLGRALALYTYEADIVGLLCSATEDYCLSLLVLPVNVTARLSA